MNILMVAEVSISNEISGAERVLYEQAAGLAARGHSVRVLTRLGADGGPERVALGAITEIRYPVDRRCALSFFFSSLRNAGRAWAALAREDPPDVIMVHQALPGLAVLSRSPAVPCVYMCLSPAHQEFEVRNLPRGDLRGRIWHHVQSRARRWTERAVVRRAERTIVLSDFIGKLVEGYHGVIADRIHVIPGGVDTDIFRPAPDRQAIRAALGLKEDEFVLFTLRNLEPRMGLEALIHAIAHARVNIPQLRLLIGGSGWLRPKLEAQVKTLGLEHCVQMLGFIPEARLLDYYRAADLFVLPTALLEGFGLVTIEALASGTPVFGTRIGATEEILKTLDPALLSEGTDAGSLSAGITALYRRFTSAPAMRARLAAEGRALVLRRYTWARHCEQVEGVLSEAIRYHSSSCQ